MGGVRLSCLRECWDFFLFFFFFFSEVACWGEGWRGVLIDYEGKRVCVDRGGSVMRTWADILDFIL